MKIFHLIVLFVLLTTQSVSAKTLLVLGDSLSAAYNMQTEQGWVALMAKKLLPTYPDLKIVNASISGETTSGGLTRLPKLIDRHQPDYIVLQLAANDGLRGTPLKIIKKNVSQLIVLSQDSGAKALLVGVRLPSNYGPRYTERFFNTFSELSQQYKTFRVPFLMDKVALNPSLMQADRLHPNAQAQPIILDNVWPQLMAMLQE
ncbi:MAG: arylesterase [Oceanospirillaceae bacterium]